MSFVPFSKAFPLPLLTTYIMLQGSAEVVFARRSDAFQASKRYNGVQLDGKPMKIEIAGANAEVPVSARVNVVGGANGRRRTVVMGYVSLCFSDFPSSDLYGYPFATLKFFS